MSKFSSIHWTFMVAFPVVMVDMGMTRVPMFDAQRRHMRATIDRA